MKKLIGTLLGVSLGLVVIGGGMYGAAVVCGAKGYETKIGNISLSATPQGFHLGSVREEWENQIEKDPEMENSLSISSQMPDGDEWQTLTAPFGSADWQGEAPVEIRADLKMCDLDIEIGKDFYLGGEELLKEMPISWKIEDGVLYLKQDEGSESLWNAFIDDVDAKIRVVLPAENSKQLSADISQDIGDVEIKSGEWTSLNVRIGTGDLEIDSSKIDIAEISIGAGDVDLEKSYISNQMTVENGTGDVEVHAQVANGIFTLGVGDFQYVDGVGEPENLQIESGTGDISLQLKGDLTEYSFDCKSALGEIKVNGKNSMGTYQEIRENVSSIVAETGLGDISIKTQS
ncbi:MAG: DUF4097 family beta strand repeat-containing protein [Candidatus Merdivicinus sp.]|jgi:hypothetical protein